MGQPRKLIVSWRCTRVIARLPRWFSRRRSRRSRCPCSIFCRSSGCTAEKITKSQNGSVNPMGRLPVATRCGRLDIPTRMANMLTPYAVERLELERCRRRGFLPWLQLRYREDQDAVAVGGVGQDAVDRLW